MRLAVKIRDEYKDVRELPAALSGQAGPVGPARPGQKLITAGRKW